MFLFTGCNDDTQQKDSSSSQWGEQLDIPIATTEANQSNQEGTNPGHTVNGSTEQNTTANENNANTAAASPAPTLVLKSLILKTQKHTLNKEENMTLNVVGSYTDNSTKDVTSQVTWEIVPRDAVKIKANTLTALKDTSVTIQARLGTVTSEPIKLSIYWEVNGHRLPPEPDKAVNDSTLLGIDVNNNGVRDDVERYIYQRFSKDLKYPKTKIAIAMQYAWATQKVLENPVIESDKYLNDAIDCQFYWFEKITRGMSGLESIKYAQKHKVFNDTALKDIMLNTKERIRQKFKFNEACSGHIFPGRKTSLKNCQAEIDIFEE
jgi:hypothetical protein